MNRVIVCCLLVVLTVLPSCIKDDHTDSEPTFPSRTVLIYMAGDNSLSGETAQKIEALRRGWQWTGNKCLVYVDTPEGARLLRLRGGCQVTPEAYVETVREYGRENSASAEVFGRVLREVMSDYPADGYGLVFFSHGSGWLPAGRLQNPSRASHSGLGGGSQYGQPLPPRAPARWGGTTVSEKMPRGVCPMQKWSWKSSPQQFPTDNLTSSSSRHA